MHSEPDEYTHTADLRSCEIGGLEFCESGNPEVAYHLEVHPLSGEDDVDLDMPLLEIKIRPYRLWLDKLKELSEQETQAKPAEPVAAH